MVPACFPHALRNVVLVSADAVLRRRLNESLTGMRWHVREAGGGAEAFAQLEEVRPEALVMDTWLPDLEAGEFAAQVQTLFPGVDLVLLDGTAATDAVRSPRRHELLHGLREAQRMAGVLTDGEDAENHARPPALAQDGLSAAGRDDALPGKAALQNVSQRSANIAEAVQLGGGVPSSDAVDADLWWDESRHLVGAGPVRVRAAATQTDGKRLRFVEKNAVPNYVAHPTQRVLPIEGLIGQADAMLELAQMIRLVAPRNATVLIQGETGTGKEVVARAVHRLSARAHKPLVVLNCAAIPEALLEAELFGHTRGAFTGAVQSRQGRIEAAHGGTLFLDEIGEMPLALQAKMLRFLECGELQKVGDNEPVKVDVRVIAATHQMLEQRAAEGTFRLDLYHRLAVFPVEVPPLRERLEDLPALAAHILARLALNYPKKDLTDSAAESLLQHDWPGNVRELEHVLERAVILCGNAPNVDAVHVRLRRRAR